MTKTSKTIIFFGNERLATGVTTDVTTLRAIISAGYRVAAIISHNEQGRSRNARKLEIEAIANSHNIPFLLPEHPANIMERLRSFNAQIGILVAYGKIIPQKIIDLFPCGIVNIHPSLLPSHRGPIPIESVILNGELRTGVSIMRLVKDMDAGPIFRQHEITISGRETKQELANMLLHEGAKRLLDILPDILEGKISPKLQDKSNATYDNLLHKQDGLLDWQKSAVQLEREIRAFAGWPRSHTTILGIDVVITNADVVRKAIDPGHLVIEGKHLFVGTIQDSIRIDRLIPAGRKEMLTSAFLSGYGKLLTEG